MAAMIALMALLGLSIGSFISVVAYRIPIGESIVSGRSRCPSCEAQIGARDNVPVLSWLLLRGRCRSCGTRIPVTYPLVELGLAALFVGAFLAFEEDAAEIVLACVFGATLASITLTDLEHRIIPNKVLIASAVIGIAIAAPTDPDAMPERLIAAAVASGVLFLAVMIRPGGMGLGDVKLAAVMGLYLGRAVAPAMLIGFLVGALYGVALIARHGSEARKRKVPFGPFLALGSVIAIFAGDDIVDWYTDSFFDGA